MFTLEGPASFVTLTHCCQEPKNTFINGKTGMAPQRNILTRPEEAAGGFRAYPQEAWVSYLLGSPWGGRGTEAGAGKRGTLLPEGGPAPFPQEAPRRGSLGWREPGRLSATWPGLHPTPPPGARGGSSPGSGPMQVFSLMEHFPRLQMKLGAGCRPLSGPPGTHRCPRGEASGNVLFWLSSQLSRTLSHLQVLL